MSSVFVLKRGIFCYIMTTVWISQTPLDLAVKCNIFYKNQNTKSVRYLWTDLLDYQ